METIKEQYLPLMETARSREEAIARLDDIIRVLRVECPWDREQDHHSLRKCLLEEAYETADAIDREDAANLREELGDVLLQVVFHASLADETGDFDLTDVINEECEKMIRRHPHVFRDEDSKTVDKVLEKWENIKEKEHHTSDVSSKLAGVPKALPALVRSYKVQAKAAKVGFDWDNVSGAFAKVTEETAELRQAMDAGDPEKIIDEMGDLLFAAVNVSRFLDIDPEMALEAATAKFIRRFTEVERMAGEQGRTLEDMDLAEMDRLWERAKAEE